MLTRSRDRAHSSSLIGAFVVGRRVADDLQLCQCCNCIIPAGADYLLVQDRDRQRYDVCRDCGPRS